MFSVIKNCKQVWILFTLLFITTRFVIADDQSFAPLVHPQKGDSVLLAASTASTWQRPTKFTGGVSVTEGSFLANAIASPGQKVVVKAKIEVEPEYIGKQADILFIIGTEPSPTPYDGGVDTTYNAIDAASSSYPVDLYVSPAQWQPQLITAFSSGVTLQPSMQFDLWQGQFDKPAMYYFFVGYRLETGDIVYNGMPIMLEVKASGNSSSPIFPGIVQLISTGIDSISLAWLPATDDNTPPEAISYRVHLSDQPNFVPSTTTLQATVAGQEKTEVMGLTAGKTYNVLIVAVDQDGNESVERDYHATTTFAKPVMISQTTSFVEDKNSGLEGATTSDGTEFIYPSGGTPPQVGSVLFANVGEDLYLRKVESATPTVSGIVVQTSNAQLTDVVTQGVINSEVTLFDVGTASARSGTRLGTRSNNGRTVMRWQDDVLVAEQKNLDQQDSTRSTREVKETVEVMTNISFTPSLRTNLVWEYDDLGGVIITEGEVIARGQFDANINASYNFEASGNAQKEIKILEREFTSRYLIGTVPVYQRNILTVKAVLSASASSEIKANAGAKAMAAVEMGVRFNPSTNSWDFIPPTPSFEKSFEANLSVKGGVHGEVRLIPNLQVEFYRVVAGDLSIEPFVFADVNVESIPKGELLVGLGYVPIQLSQFDVNLQVQAFVGVSLGILSAKFPLLDKTQIWESPPWLLFSLPQLSVSGGSGPVNQPIALSATIQEGEHNLFEDSSIQWLASPNNATVSGDRSGTLTAGVEGNYTVFFSGHGALGDLARQFVAAEVSVGKDKEPEPPKEPEIPKYHGIPNRCHGIPNQCPTLPIGTYENKDAQGRLQGTYISVTEEFWGFGTRVDGFPAGPAGWWSTTGDCEPIGIHCNYTPTPTSARCDGTEIDFGSEARTSYEMLTIAEPTVSSLIEIYNGPHGHWLKTGNCEPVGNHGDYVNNKRNGTWTIIAGDDTIGFDKGLDHNNDLFVGSGFMKVTYVDGILTGPWGEWDDDGNPVGCHGNLVNGEPAGVWTCYYDGSSFTTTYVNEVEQ